MKFNIKFLIIFCLSILAFTFISRALATEYEGDGTYLLLVGDKIKASNGYIIELALAWGEFGSRSDWRTDLVIYNPQGEIVRVVGGWGNYTDENVDSGPIETETLYITIERHVENEAIITVISKYETAPEFTQMLIPPLILVLSTAIMLAKYKIKI